jgi:glucose/arabinose dehydrogenase
MPWGLAFLPDGTALVTERDTTRLLSVTVDGRITEVRRFTEARLGGWHPGGGGEGGLLGLAVSPRYSTDRWVYVYYTTETDNRIARFRLGEAPQPILTGIPNGQVHNGGRIAFGPDGMLYASTGETGRRELAQDRNSLADKILRITSDGRPAPGNPFGDSAVYSLGHRNVQGLAWDSRGQLYASEFGEDRSDELNRIEPGGNYGWPTVEGTGRDPRFVNPIATWRPVDASPSGIAIVGTYIYLACLRGQRLYRVGLDGGDAQAMLVRTYGRIRTVVPAPDGSLWLLTSNRDVIAGNFTPPAVAAATDDRILRVVI